METGIIYKVTNNINGKVYIGKTIKDLETRKKGHYYFSKTYRSTYFQNSLLKYGFENFTWDIIYSGEDISNFEKLFIIQYKSNIKDFGYNLTVGGDGASPGDLNVSKREEVREKLRINSTGFKHKKETIDKLREYTLNQFKNGMPIETRDKISKSSMGHFANKGPNSKLSKQYILISPIGQEVLISGMREFCRDNELCHSSLIKVYKGKLKSYKGWKRKQE